MDLEEKRRKRREYAAKWRAANPQRHRDINKKSREKNAEAIKERNNKKYHETKHLKLPLTESQKLRRYEVNRAFRLMQDYGLTLEDYDNLLKRQLGVCAICKKPEAHNRRLAVDHCHATGKVRGLLCTHCNTGIGVLGDTAEHLRQALAYLEGKETLNGEYD